MLQKNIHLIRDAQRFSRSEIKNFRIESAKHISLNMIEAQKNKSEKFTNRWQDFRERKS